MLPANQLDESNVHICVFSTPKSYVALVKVLSISSKFMRGFVIEFTISNSYYSEAYFETSFQEVTFTTVEFVS